MSVLLFIFSNIKQPTLDLILDMFDQCFLKACKPKDCCTVKHLLTLMVLWFPMPTNWHLKKKNPTNSVFFSIMKYTEMVSQGDGGYWQPWTLSNTFGWCLAYCSCSPAANCCQTWLMFHLCNNKDELWYRGPHDNRPTLTIETDFITNTRSLSIVFCKDCCSWNMCW